MYIIIGWTVLGVLAGYLFERHSDIETKFVASIVCGLIGVIIGVVLASIFTMFYVPQYVEKPEIRKLAQIGAKGNYFMVDERNVRIFNSYVVYYEDNGRILKKLLSQKRVRVFKDYRKDGFMEIYKLKSSPWVLPFLGDEKYQVFLPIGGVLIVGK